MKLSVIICTYRRPDSLKLLLRSLASQTAQEFEVLIVDGADGEALAETRRLAATVVMQAGVRVIAAPKGLTKQRNAGLRAAAGEIVCFLDDDVTFESDFLPRMVALFDKEDMSGVGGLTAYDIIHYPQKINLRWRLRKHLGIVPSLQPGAINRLGASVPVSFFEPFTGCERVGYFYGFCMAFRRDAIAGMCFDETLPTYGGEDRDFTFRLSQRWPLVLCGDLPIRHERSQQSRDSLVERTYQTGYGAGRTFAKSKRSALDYLPLAWSMAGEFLIDWLAFVQGPCLERCQMPIARLAGTLAGVFSNPPKETGPIMAVEQSS